MNGDGACVIICSQCIKKEPASCPARLPILPLIMSLVYCAAEIQFGWEDCHPNRGSVAQIGHSSSVLEYVYNLYFLKTNTLGADFGFIQLLIPINVFINPVSSP